MQREAAYVATLSKCPRDLHVLWNEYKFGIGGRKAAKNFSSSERGKVKIVYAKRHIVWRVISCMILAGYSAQQAIGKIYEVYGQISVTGIINRLRQDEMAGGNIQLR